ncbi:MAG: heme A synthase [Acidobacteria bacterium]|nr:heme A synthase [Acidobacteriota bacterium]
MPRLARYAWAVLLYNLGVIAWGAYVRATGSGAGCGNHWPLCNGEILPRAAGLATLIEFSHRVTSGLALVSVVVLLVWTRRAAPAGHPTRGAAAASVGFMISEALLGAGLVLFHLVAGNTSLLRAGMAAAHLLNTFALVAALALTAWWASGGAEVDWRSHRSTAGQVALNTALIMLVSCSGAVTALGDTLFPASSLSEGIGADLASSSHMLVRLRTIHPVLAIASAFGLMSAAWRMGQKGTPESGRLARALILLIVTQLAVGASNVFLLVPVWLQMVHLLLADTIWILFVLLSAAVMAIRPSVQPAHSAVPFGPRHASPAGSR